MYLQENEISGDPDMGSIAGCQRETTVLVVFDSPAHAMHLKGILEKNGYSVISAQSGVEALDLMKKDMPEIIISDIVMPEMDGYELCRRVRRDDNLKYIPIILLTSLTETNDLLEGLKCGASNFITKPYHEQHLISQIERVLSSQHLRGKKMPLSEIDIFFDGEKHRIVSDAMQMLDFLLFAYENAVQKNRELLIRNEQLQKSQLELEKFSVQLEAKIKKRTERIARLNNILQSIRNVDQLIVRERDLDKLLQKACESLAAPFGFDTAWIILLDRDGTVGRMAGAGLGEEKRHYFDQIKNGFLPDCARRALLQREVVQIENDSDICCRCPLVSDINCVDTLTVRLEMQGRVFGVLTVSMPTQIVPMEEKINLLKELSSDIAFALYNIELEQEQRRAENALADSEKQYRGFVENSLVGVIRCTMAGEILYCNEAFAKIFEFDSVQTAMAVPTQAYYKDADQRHTFINRLKADHSVTAYELEVRTGSGKTKKVIVSGSLDNGVYSGMIQDVSDFRQAEEERSLLSRAIEQVDDTMMIIGRDAVVKYINPALERISGFSAAEVVGKNLLDAGCALGQEDHFRSEIWKILGEGNSWSGDIRAQKKDGDYYDLKATVSPVYDETGNIVSFVSIGQDITREKQFAEQLRQAQKMEAIGTLAGGIAHDFNNILNVISGCAELTVDDVSEMPDASSNIINILTAVDRAKGLVQQILAFSRKGEEEQKPVKVIPIVKELVKFLRATLPTTISIRANIKSVPDIVIADPTQIHQVIMNLCTNAWHAMRNRRGELNISVDKLEVKMEDAAFYPELTEGPYVSLKITDTGHGIPKDILEHIFEPYYTTKAKGDGTGLGLSVVHGIVKNLEGMIRVSSEVEKGTTFQVCFPVEQYDDQKKDLEKDRPVIGGKERILFVDDEEDIVNMSQQMLVRLGYRVDVTTNASEALEKFRKQKDDYDLIITDKTMPHMTGFELLKAVRNIRPDVPVILCTGFGEEADAEMSSGLGVNAFLEKPVFKQAMAGTIREVLDGKKHP